MAIKWSPGCGCCGGSPDAPCSCDPVTLDFAPDGAGGLLNWYPDAPLSPSESGSLPTIESDMTLVSKEDVLCSGPHSPFHLDMRNNANLDGDTGARIRIMTRVSATVSDGIATIGDHCFVELGWEQHPWLVAYTNMVGYCGVNISGVDTFVSCGPVLWLALPQQVLSFYFYSAQASNISKRQIKFLASDDASFGYVDYVGNGGRQMFLVGDCFVVDTSPEFIDPSYASLVPGAVYRVTSKSPLEYERVIDPALEFTDTMLSGGRGTPHGVSGYLSDVGVDLSAMTGRRVGLRVSGLASGESLDMDEVVTKNSLSWQSPLCDYEPPQIQLWPILRETAYPVLQGDITGTVSSLETTGFVPVDMPFIGSSSVDRTYPQIRRWDYFKSAIQPSGLYQYAKAEIYVDLGISQETERSCERGVMQLLVVLWEVASFSDYSLEQLEAGDLGGFTRMSGRSWHARDDQSLPSQQWDTHMVPETISATFQAVSTRSGSNYDKIEAYGATMTLQVPQP